MTIIAYFLFTKEIKNGVTIMDKYTRINVDTFVLYGKLINFANETKYGKQGDIEDLRWDCYRVLGRNDSKKRHKRNLYGYRQHICC